MIQTFIKDSNYNFDLGNIYKHLLINQDHIDQKLIVEAYHSLVSFKKGKVKPSIPFYPKNWEYVKNELEEFSKNQQTSSPNRYYFEKTNFDELLFSSDEKSQILLSTSKKIPDMDSSYEYDWDKWKEYQYDIYSLEEQYVIPWENTEFHKYWLSWYLVLMDQSLYDNLSDFIIALTGIDLNDLRDFLKDLYVKNLDIFQLTDWATKKDKLLASSKSDDPDVKIEDNLVTIKRPVKRKKDDTLTCLTSDQTNLLFRYLQQSEIIIKDQSIQSNSNLAKLISGLTGYNFDSQRSIIQNPSKKDLKEIITKLNVCINLINNDLK